MCGMGSVGIRPEADGAVVQDSIVWATALLPKPDGAVTAAMRRMPTPRSDELVGIRPGLGQPKQSDDLVR